MKERGARHAACRRRGGLPPTTCSGGRQILGRDVFRPPCVRAPWEVMKIAPFATLFAFMVGITPGTAGRLLPRPARHGSVVHWPIRSRLPGDPALYLLVTPREIRCPPGCPHYMAMCSSFFPDRVSRDPAETRANTASRRRTARLSRRGLRGRRGAPISRSSPCLSTPLARPAVLARSVAHPRSG